MHYCTIQNIINHNQVTQTKSPTGNILLFWRLNLIIWSQEFGGKSGLLERAEKRAAPFVNPCKWNGGGDRTKVRELAEQKGEGDKKETCKAHLDSLIRIRMKSPLPSSSSRLALCWKLCCKTKRKLVWYHNHWESSNPDLRLRRKHNKNAKDCQH